MSLAKLGGAIFLLLLATYLTLCRGERPTLPGARLDIRCDPESVGGLVFVDGELAGKLRGWQSAGKFRNGTVFNNTRCDGIGIRALRGEVSYDKIRAETGRRELSVACPDGSRIVQNITVDAENYVSIYCKRGEIVGRP
jgi:hypothetical protein